MYMDILPFESINSQLMTIVSNSVEDLPYFVNNLMIILISNLLICHSVTNNYKRITNFR